MNLIEIFRNLFYTGIFFIIIIILFIFDDLVDETI